MPTYELDGTWFEPMYQALPPLIEHIRAGHGPVLIEGQVIRWIHTFPRTISKNTGAQRSCGNSANWIQFFKPNAT
jgi:TPP-dependent pyruvate/acetoin dehydrogenase alpha subunit